MVTGGANLGRIGVITNRERHPGSFDVVHVKDSTGNSFATRLSNIFVIGKVRTRTCICSRFSAQHQKASETPFKLSEIIIHKMFVPQLTSGAIGARMTL